MNALQPLKPQEYPPLTSSVMPKRRRRRSSHRGVVAEITLKLLINAVLCTAAVTAFLKLMPYHITQQEKLQEVQHAKYPLIQQWKMQHYEIRNNWTLTGI